MNSHRQRAKRKTVAWQAGAIALLAAGIGVGFLPLGTMFGPGKHALPKDAVVDTAVQKPVSMGAGAVLNLADNLKRISGKRDIPPPAPPPPDDPGTAAAGTDEPAPPPPVANTDWMYIGHMIGPTFKRAIITVGAAEAGAPQISLGEGDTHSGTKLVSISTDHLMVDPGDGNQKRIDLASRAASTSWNTEAPRRPITARGIPGMGAPGQPGMGMNPGQSGFTSPNAAAMAEAQRRMKAAIAPPPVMAPQDEHADKMAAMAKELGELDQDKRDTLMKIMSDPNIDPDERGRLLREVGIPVEATPEQRGQFLEMIGVGPQNDPKLYEMLREGGGAK